MGLVLTVKLSAKEKILAKVALSIAMESYSDLQNGFGILMRQQNIFKVDKTTNFISKIENAKEGNITIDMNNAVLLVTAFDITIKVLSSGQAGRFIHAFENDFTKRMKFKADTLEFCRSMIADLSEQALFRSEIAEQKNLLNTFKFD